MSKEGHFLVGAETLGYLGGSQEERNSPKSIVITGKSDGKSLFWLPGLKRHLKFNLEIPYEKFQQSRF